MRPLTSARRLQAEFPRDPAPSRFAYRLDRLWLTPLFRALVRIGLPALAAILVLGIYFGDATRREALLARLGEVRRSIEDRPEFMVRLMAIDGASPAVADGVRKMLPVTLPESSFRIDLEAMRASIAQIDAVAGVDIRIRPGGVLQVDIRERVPVILWRNGPRIEMLDASGNRVATLVNRTARPDLPLIAGDGADRRVDEALAIFGAASPILPRVRGLARIGDRRWDVVLDRSQRIMLPETGAAAAMERVIALDQAEDLLARDVLVVDMRSEDRPTVRLAQAAADELRRKREIVTKVSRQ
ncbi:MAG: cell division protein FtsQ/DivIB [Pseudomonadota bacterium]